MQIERRNVTCILSYQITSLQRFIVKRWRKCKTLRIIPVLFSTGTRLAIQLKRINIHMKMSTQRGN